MLVNVCTKQEVLDHFNLWLLDKYGWLGFKYCVQIMTKANELLTEDLDYYADAGHRVLYNAITGG